VGTFLRHSVLLVTLVTLLMTAHTMSFARSSHVEGSVPCDIVK